MPVLSIPTPRRQSAGGIYLPDPGLSRGLVGHWLGDSIYRSGGMSAEDRSGKGYTGAVQTVTQRWADGPHPSLQAMRFDGTTAGLALPAVELAPPSATPFGYLVWCYLYNMAAATTQNFFRLDSGGSAPFISLGVTFDVGVIKAFVAITGGTNFFSPTIVTPTNGVWYHVGMSWAGTVGTSIFTFLNGVETDIGTATESYVNPNFALNLVGYDNFGEYLSGSVSSLRLYNRVLRGGDVRAIYETERLGLEEAFDHALGRAFVSVGAGGPTYTLALDAGAIPYTGNAAALQAARRLTAGTASYAYAGSAARLAAVRRLTAATASFPLTGQPASLTASRKLTAGTGTFPFTGYPVDLTEGGGITYTLPAGTGAFAYAGQDVSLKASRVLTTQTVNIPFTGYPLSFLYSADLTEFTVSEFLAQARAAHSLFLSLRNQDKDVAAEAAYGDAYSFRTQANAVDPGHSSTAWADERVPDQVIQEFYANRGAPSTPGAPGSPGGGAPGVDAEAVTALLARSMEYHRNALIARAIPDTEKAITQAVLAFNDRMAALALDPDMTTAAWQLSDHDALIAFYNELFAP